MLPVAFAFVFFSSVLAEPANAAYGSSGAAVTSPAVVKSLTLEEFLNLPEKKQRQFEGEPRFARQWCCGFLSCVETVDKNSKSGKKRVCKPVSVIDGLLNDMKEDERKFLELYQKVQDLDAGLEKPNASEEEQRRNDELLVEQERLLQRQKILRQIGMEPAWVNYAAGFTASCVSTVIVHPIDTIKTRMMASSGKKEGKKEVWEETSVSFAGGEGWEGWEGEEGLLEEGEGIDLNYPPPTIEDSVSIEEETNPFPTFNVLELYNGVLANILKEVRRPPKKGRMCRRRWRN
ncbi:hypothetical protein TL16_g04980 [Triparma laevis f. inornata]|uniref:Uncharacterized protein n=1 Tax=Triparma laevis f. inornata TaxID=1714386 RepID=A0A9W7AAD9_9STRA|nr:hypothetical protein TL16_g04980 [Triparma laevis f. inornata]